MKASPIARRMAREMGLELAGVKGTGPGGRIVKADIEAAAKQEDKPAEKEEPKDEEEAPKKKEKAPASSTPAAATSTHEELSRLQRTVARRMAESKATAPDFVMTLEVDMEEAVQLRGQLKAAAGEDAPAPSFNDFVIKAAALALRDFPRANGAYRDGQFELYSRINIGVAVAGQDALVVPTVFDADKKSLGTIAVRVTRTGREGARGLDLAAGAVGGHVHDLQPRHVRHPPLHGRHQPAAGRDPGRRRAHTAARGAGRRDRGPRDHGAHALAATTGSCTAPTRPSSSAGSASTWRRRYGLRSRRPVTGWSVSSTVAAVCSTVSST